MIEIKNLCYSIGEYVLSVPELVFKKNRISVLYGENGSGKSTLLKIICNLIYIDKGTVLIDSEKNSTCGWKEYAAVYLGEKFLLPFLTPMEYLKLVATIHNTEEDKITDFVNKTEELIGRKIFTVDKYIRNLSDGSRKIIGIFSQFIYEPRLIILDEPFEGLDDKATEILIDFISLDRDKTVVLSTHRKIDEYLDKSKTEVFMVKKHDDNATVMRIESF